MDVEISLRFLSLALPSSGATLYSTAAPAAEAGIAKVVTSDQISCFASLLYFANGFTVPNSSTLDCKTAAKLLSVKTIDQSPALQDLLFQLSFYFHRSQLESQLEQEPQRQLYSLSIDELLSCSIPLLLPLFISLLSSLNSLSLSLLLTVSTRFLAAGAVASAVTLFRSYFLSPSPLPLPQLLPLSTDHDQSLFCFLNPLSCIQEVSLSIAHSLALYLLCSVFPLGSPLHSLDIFDNFPALSASLLSSRHFLEGLFPHPHFLLPLVPCPCP
jgi:hypothetical protein